VSSSLFPSRSALFLTLTDITGILFCRRLCWPTTCVCTAHNIRQASMASAGLSFPPYVLGYV
jgi:hypothetical protein